MAFFLKRFLVGHVQKLVELIIFFKWPLLFVTVGFVYSRFRSTVTDGGCRQIHLTREFSHSLIMYNHTSCSSVCTHASPNPHAIHDEQLSVCSSLSLRSDSLRVSLLHFALLFPLQPVLCPEPLLPCGQRQGKHTLRLRQPTSLALWENSLLPQGRKMKWWHVWGLEEASLRCRIPE